MIDQNTDPLLNQQACALESHNETLFRSEFGVPQPSKGKSLLRKERHRGLKRCDIIEQLITPKSSVNISNINGKHKVTIKDSEGVEILGPFLIKSTDMGHSAASADQEIINVKREKLAPNVDSVMPRINGDKGLNLFLCPEPNCTEAHVKIAAAKQHALMHLNIKPYFCDHPGCCWKFYTHPKLKRHLETHKKRKDYQCNFEGCGRCFTTLYNYKEHKKKHELPAVIHCLVANCNVKFQNYQARNEHIKSHDRSEAGHVCPVTTCKRRFFSSTTLSSHSRSHSYDAEDVTCSICGKEFSLPCRLRSHLRKHTGERPHPCHICNLAFQSSSKLKRHIATHTNDRKYCCNVCDKKFLRSETLKDHMDTHGLNLVQCKVCFVYYTKEDHANHMKTAHPEKKAKCETVTQAVPEPPPSGDVLLEQAIQSLGVPSDMMLPSYIEEPTLDFLDPESFSTVNLRDFGINI